MQNTAYDMRMSDWSSDVCSSDLQHEASLRLFPTSQPHMLGTLFSHLCPLGVPAGDKIWESTRLCLPQRHGAERRRTLRNALISAMVDVALEIGRASCRARVCQSV